MTQQDAIPAPPKFAGFWIRLLAHTFDTYLLSAVVWGLLFFVHSTGIALTDPDKGLVIQLLALMKTPLGTILFILQWIMMPAYFILCHASRYQATVGKYLLGLKIYTENGWRLTITQALIRQLVIISMVLPLLYIFTVIDFSQFDPDHPNFELFLDARVLLAWVLIDLMLVAIYVPAAFTKEKTGLHDLIGKTRVVHDRSPGTAQIIIVVFTLLGFQYGSQMLSPQIMGKDFEKSMREWAAKKAYERHQERTGTASNKVQKFSVDDLRAAAQHGNVAEVKRLLDSGADINGTDSIGITALHLAKTPEVATLLLDRGADINAKEKTGVGPLQYVITPTRSIDMVRLLLARGADVNGCEKGCRTPLHMAALNSRKDILLLLLEHHANPNITDERGFTPLHYACQLLRFYESTDIVKNLLKAGADPYITNNDGRTPLDLVPSEDKEKVQELLQNKTSD